MTNDLAKQKEYRNLLHKQSLVIHKYDPKLSSWDTPRGHTWPKQRFHTEQTKLCAPGARYFGIRYFIYTSAKDNPPTQSRFSPPSS